MWKRFIDDIFIIWTHGREKLDNFIRYLNLCHDTIKFTAEISNTNIDFPEITVKTNTSGIISTTLYSKPTNSYNYLLYSSEHPRHILNGIPYSQFLRIRRICSDDTDFKKNAFMLSTHFVRRGFPKHLILSALKRCLALRRDDILNKDLLREEKNTNNRTQLSPGNKNKFYCITTHNPQNPPIKSLVVENWDLLQKTKTTRHLQDAQIIFGLRRNKNLSDQLVRASTSTPNSIGHYLEDHPCKRPTTCRYCCRLNKTGKILSMVNKKTFTSRTQVNCQSSNLIYLITCTHCKIQYVGQTKKRLLTRFQGHHYDIKSQNDTTVSRHFNKCPPLSPALFNGVQISVLSFIKAPADSSAGQTERDREEKRWIHRLQSVVPQGLNLMD